MIIVCLCHRDKVAAYFSQQEASRISFLFPKMLGGIGFKLLKITRGEPRSSECCLCTISVFFPVEEHLNFEAFLVLCTLPGLGSS